MKKPEIRSGVADNQYILNRKIATQEDKAKLAKQLIKERERDAELVTGVFKNLESPASNGGRGAVKFSYKMYHGDDNIIYDLEDGERYMLPRGVARHLNNNCFYREYKHLQGEFGQQGVRQSPVSDGRAETQTYQASRKVHRYAFHSLEYMDDDAEMNPVDLVEVTAAL